MESAVLRAPPASAAPAASVEDPYYYLHNFQTVVDWVLDRYRDLLLAEEIETLERFATLPRPSRALLVRMIMRKGTLFRASKLRYAEIGLIERAVEPLLALGWVEQDGLLDVASLFALSTRDELGRVFGGGSGRKSDWLAASMQEFPDARRFSEWCAGSADCVYTLHLMPLCDRLRLMFFGNLGQDWTEFILADLGVYRFERVEFSIDSRAFHTRRDIDDYLWIHRCRESFEAEQPISSIVADLLQLQTGSAWTSRRRMKLLFKIGYACERTGELEQALALYETSGYPGTVARRVRVLEKLQRFNDALQACEAALQNPSSEAELQQLQRQWPRLRRCAGLDSPRREQAAIENRIDLILPKPVVPCYVEDVVRDHFTEATAPVHYVENTLINSLFGLLCWEAIFAPVPGAFFHPFQHGPADLLSVDFQRRRAHLFEPLLRQLESDAWRTTVHANYRAKQGLQSPFVYWSTIDDTLLDLALECLPASHLRLMFERLLTDIGANRAGLPDLIQFLPAQRSYRMIEVKGPGDRLQDNQKRWIAYCNAHAIPVAVCYVQWQEADA